MFLNSLPTVDLFDTVLRLRGGGVVEPTGRAGLAAADWPEEWIVAAFRVDDDEAAHSDIWERHPAGQELLFLLAGAVTVHLRDEIPDATTLRAGQSFVIPAGRWHRLSVREPAELLAITPPLGTQHQPVTGHRQSEEN